MPMMPPQFVDAQRSEAVGVRPANRVTGLQREREGGDLAAAG